MNKKSMGIIIQGNRYTPLEIRNMKISRSRLMACLDSELFTITSRIEIKKTMRKGCNNWADLIKLLIVQD